VFLLSKWNKEILQPQVLSAVLFLFYRLNLPILNYSGFNYLQRFNYV